MAFPGEVLDLHLDLHYGGAWHEHTTAVRGMGAEDGELEIRRGSPNETSRSRPTALKFALNDHTGLYSVLHPSSPLYGLVGQGTPVRAHVGTLPVAATNLATLDAATTSHVMPSVVAPTSQGILFTAASAADLGDYGIPTGMTGLVEVDNPVTGTDGMTSRMFRQIISSAGATGTRTSTFSAAAPYVASSVWINGPSSVSSGSIGFTDGDVVIDGDPGDLWIIFVTHNWVEAFDQVQPLDKFPWDTDGGGWTFVEESDTGPVMMSFPLVSRFMRMYALVKTVKTANSAHTIKFPYHAGSDFASCAIARVPADQIAPFHHRAHTQISAMRPRRAGSGNVKWVPVESAGVLQRLESNRRLQPLRSPVYREVTSVGNAEHLIAYWPCEDASGATSVAAGIPGVQPMHVGGAVQMATYEGFRGSEPLPGLTGTQFLRGLVPAYPAGATFYRGLFALPAGGVDNGTRQVRLFTSTGLTFQLTRAASGARQLQVFDSDDTLVDQSGSVTLTGINGSQFQMSIELVQDGADVDWLIYQRIVDADGQTTSDELGLGTFAGMTLGYVSRLLVGSGIGSGSGPNTWYAGHHMIGTSQQLVFGIQRVLAGWVGETPTRRAGRLCQEEGIDFASIGDPDLGPPMGPQPTGTLIDLLHGCEDAEHGLLFEPREFDGLAMRTLGSMYNQAPLLTLDGAAGQIAPPWSPTPDTLLLRDDVTVERIGGGSSRAVREGGPLNAPVKVDLNLMADAQTEDHATWLLNEGTQGEPRFPAIKVNLARDPGLIDVAARLDVGDRLAVTGPPDDVPPDDLSQVACGFTERLSQFRWELDTNTRPEAPYHIAEVEHDDYDIIGSDSASSTEALDTTETGVDITAGAGPDWVHEADFDIMIGGERMTVTAVSAMAGTFPARTCTLTVTRSANGIVKEHNSGAPITFATQPHIGL